MTGAPYLARFSRDVGFHCSFPLALDSSDILSGQHRWYPTSREKRARYGPPVLCEGTRAYEAEFTLAHQGGQGILDRGCLPGRNRVAPEAVEFCEDTICFRQGLDPPRISL